MSVTKFLHELRTNYHFYDKSEEFKKSIDEQQLEQCYLKSEDTDEYLENINNVPYLLKFIYETSMLRKTEIKLLLMLIEDLLQSGKIRDILFSDLAKQSGLAESAVSRSLTILESHNCVIREKKGKKKVVTLIFDCLFNEDNDQE